MDLSQIGRIDIIRKSSNEAGLLGSQFAHVEVCFGTSTDILPSAALFRSLQWIDSRYWNGRNAVIVVEMDNGWLSSVLIGPNAIVVIEGQSIRVHALCVAYQGEDVYGSSPIQVSTPDSVMTEGSYLSAVEDAYHSYRQELERALSKWMESAFLSCNIQCTQACWNSPMLRGGIRRLLYLALTTLATWSIRSRTSLPYSIFTLKWLAFAQLTTSTNWSWSSAMSWETLSSKTHHLKTSRNESYQRWLWKSKMPTLAPMSFLNLAPFWHSFLSTSCSKSASLSLSTISGNLVYFMFSASRGIRVGLLKQ